jgi:hypothetical protein
MLLEHCTVSVGSRVYINYSEGRPGCLYVKNNKYKLHSAVLFSAVPLPGIEFRTSATADRRIIG